MNDLGQVGVETVYRDLPTCIQSLHIFIAYVGTNNVTATTDVPSPIPILCFSGIQVTQVSAGENHAVATTESPSVVWAWGDHRCGQLGIGELAKVTSPRPIQALSGAVVAQVSLLLTMKRRWPVEEVTPWLLSEPRRMWRERGGNVRSRPMCGTCGQIQPSRSLSSSASRS